MSEFWKDGGWGMYPTLVFGFFLVAAAGLYALRADERYGRAWLAFAVTTAGAGVLGWATGVCTTIKFALGLPPEKQFPIFMEGNAESLHNIVLAFIIIVISGLIASVGALRRPSLTGATATG